MSDGIARAVNIRDFRRQFTSRSGITHLLVANGTQLGKITVADFLNGIYEEPDNLVRYVAVVIRLTDTDDPPTFTADHFTGTHGKRIVGNADAVAVPTLPTGNDVDVWFAMALKTQVGPPKYFSLTDVNFQEDLSDFVIKQGTLDAIGSDGTFDIYYLRGHQSVSSLVDNLIFFREDAERPSD